MTDRTITCGPGATQLPAARLEPDAISAAQDTHHRHGQLRTTVGARPVDSPAASAAAYGSVRSSSVRCPDADHRQRVRD